MRKLWLMWLWSTLAFGQAGVIANTALSSKTPTYPGAQVRVCPLTSTGIPCTPTSPIFQDQAESQPLGNPMSADQYGNYSFFAAPGFYTLQITPPGQSSPYFIYIAEIPSDPFNPTFNTVTLTGPITQVGQATSKSYVDSLFASIPVPFYQRITGSTGGIIQRSTFNFSAAFNVSDTGTATSIDAKRTGSGLFLVSSLAAPSLTVGCAQYDTLGNLGNTSVPCLTGNFLTSFQGRATAAAALTLGDVTGVLGYTPANVNGSNATGTWPIAISGNSGTTTRLATAGTPCTGTLKPSGVDVSGNSIGCTAPITTVDQNFAVTGCTPGTSTDSTCSGTITLPASFADTTYFPQLQVSESSGAFLFAVVTGALGVNTIPYTITCTFNCSVINAPTIYVWARHN